MNLRRLWNEDYLLWEALLLSVVLHSLMFHAGVWSFHFQQKHTVEIDITNMGHVRMTASPRKAAPQAPAPKPVVRPKEWMKPAPNQKVEPAPTPTEPVAAPLPEEAPPAEYNIGTGDASTVLSRIPQLLNLSDLRAILQRFYPEEARSQGREGTVVLEIHIDTDGHVASVDVARSGGSDFDAAAKRAAGLLRFTPAFLGSRRVAVKMHQAIQFKLED